MVKKHQGIQSYEIIGLVAIGIIIISLATLGISFTGKVTDTAKVNLTIESTASINFTTSLIQFESGMVTSGQSYSILVTNGTVSNGNWTAVSDGFILENNGNKAVTLDIKTGLTNATMIGGTLPRYEYNVSNSKAGSCNVTGVTFTLGVFQNVNTTSDGTRVCEHFSPNSTQDTIRIDILIGIPADSYTGVRSDTMTATATAVA